VKNNILTRSLQIITIFLASLLLASCAAPQSTSSATQESGQAQQAAAESVAEAEVATIDDYEGDGMDLPLDGTSLAAFEASLARVKQHSDADQYKDLMNALDYLLIYDLTVKGNRAQLARELDSLTGYEVLKKVRRAGAGRNRNTPAENAIET